MTLPTTPAAQSPDGARSRWAWRDRPAIAWLVAAAVLSLVHPFVPESRWLMVHAVMLGTVTHAIVVWSTHFTQALTKVAPEPRSAQTRRLVLLHGGVLLVVAGILTGAWPVTVVGAGALSGAVLWHGWALSRMIRRSLTMRIAVTGRYYVAAALALPVGAGLGATLARGTSTEWTGRLLLAHTMTMLLGWVGLTVMGTLLTLWPTMLPARMAPDTERRARQAFWPALVGLGIVVGSALAGLRPVAVTGLGVWVAATLWWGRTLLAPLRQRAPLAFAPASVAAGLVWWLVALVSLSAHVLRAPDMGAVADGYGPIAAMLVVGFALQLVTGALSYLVPVVVGGGPTVRARVQAPLEGLGAARLVLVNAGLALCLLPVPSAVRVTCSVLVLVGLLGFLLALARALRAAAVARRDAGPEATSTDRPPTVTGPRRPAPFWTAGQLIGAVSALAIGVSLGIGADPAAAGLGAAAATTRAPAGGAPAAAPVVPTGRTQRVEVRATADMRYEPASITVQRGDRLVISLTNADPTNRHDLVFARARTDRLAQGRSAELDLGVIGASEQGWCSVVGHRQMGMVLDIVVAGDAPAGEVAAGASGHAAHGPTAAPTGHAAHHAPSDPHAPAPPAVDPVLPPLGPERVHRHTFTVTEVPLQVSPGVWQTRWTFNGGVPGPTLHGRVGDRFVITLVNRGSMGHSIDFHAGVTPPDRAMRTIPPGQSLTYEFTAGRAGIWMYHCSTMPMSAHIAAGMHGAVVIEPPDLPRVDRQFVLVQSEVHLGARTGKDAPDPVDADAALADRPSLFTFNGVANQYVARPLRVRPGERVRMWVLDAGPNRSSSFHVVGGQFDTTYTEGRYTLRPGRGETGGAQVLPLLPAQGGFVELTLPEPGTYPFVTHVMADAERGAKGLLAVR